MSDQGDAGQTGATADAGQQTSGDNADAGQTGGRTYTDADIQHIVQQRLASERQKYADYNDLKAKAEQFDQLRESQKSELEKAQERAAKYERELEVVREQATEHRVNAAILTAAHSAGIIDPDAAVRLVDHSALKLDEQGNPTNVGDVVAALAEAKPWLRGTGGRPAGSADGGARGGASNKVDMDALLRAAAKGR